MRLISFARMRRRIRKALRHLDARWLPWAGFRQTSDAGRQQRLCRTVEHLSRQCDDLKRRILAAQQQR